MATLKQVRRPDHSRSVRRRRWLIAAMVAFLLVDVVLVASALAGPKPADKAGMILTPPNSPGPHATDAAGATPAGSPKPSSIVAVAPNRILAALDGSIAWRATTGSCPDASARPELTTDGGGSWKTTDATAFTQVTALQRILVTGEGEAAMVGLSAEGCEPQFIETFVAGDNYVSYPEELGSTWFTIPADLSSVHSPAGDSATPCDTVISLAPRGADAAGLLCADGDVYETTDGAASWAQATQIPGAVSLTAFDGAYIAAVVGTPTCPGVQIVNISGQPDATNGCFAVNKSARALAGNVALSAAADTIWLWAADLLVRSIDDGLTWQ